MFQFLKRHIIKATCSLRRGGRRRHFGVVFQVGGESERAIFVFFTAPPKGRKHSDYSFKRLRRIRHCQIASIVGMRFFTMSSLFIIVVFACSMALPQDEKTFNKPRWFDDRLDWCLIPGKKCGKPAADNFCKRRRYTGARNFAQDPDIGGSEPTRISGTNQVCNSPICDGFKFITCYAPIPPERVKANPVWKGYRLDSCLRWATDCGQPAADAYCRNEGYSRAFYFVLDPERGSSSTRVISSDRICTGKGCVGFQMIICE